MEQQQEETREEALTRAIETRQDFRDLLKCPGWGQLDKVLEGQAKNRLDELVKPVGGLDNAFRLEYEKGVRDGILLARRLPALIVEGLDIEIQETSEELDRAAGNS